MRYTAHLPFFLPLILGLLLCSQILLAQEQISFDHIIKIDERSNVGEIQIRYYLPPSIPCQQEINSIEYKPEPEIIMDGYGRPVALFQIKEPKEDSEILIQIEANLYPNDLHSAIMRDTTCLSNPHENLTPYLAERKGDRGRLQMLKTLSLQIPDTTRAEMLRAIYLGLPNFMLALNSHKDIVTEPGSLIDLMIDLCRIKGIPAKKEKGLLSLSLSFHERCKVYFEEYGWVSFDVLHDALNSRESSFAKISADFLGFENEIYSFRLLPKREHFKAEIEINSKIIGVNLCEEIINKMTAHFPFADPTNFGRDWILAERSQCQCFEYYRALALYHMEQKEYDQALIFVQTALKTAYPEHEEFKAYCVFATYLAKTENKELAIQYLEKAAGISPLLYGQRFKTRGAFDFISDAESLVY